eukprot:CAMPEP_0176245236 /NCGR_PEP_ID=MMETSP0121_2-20121125/31839_1 /TAXON_ID=160619 /ORGANISM="Kryptoperidinium foliaceum, Strain CCMP 1326" /LENGTH=128 /DNA_ID=CAMNT_0017584861 /DNA_START=143 /DNA_END=526 /DNA_ORIENTATION=-
MPIKHGKRERRCSPQVVANRPDEAATTKLVRQSQTEHRDPEQAPGTRGVLRVYTGPRAKKAVHEFSAAGARHEVKRAQTFGAALAGGACRNQNLNSLKPTKRDAILQCCESPTRASFELRTMPEQLQQ